VLACEEKKLCTFSTLQPPPHTNRQVSGTLLVMFVRVQTVQIVNKKVFVKIQEFLVTDIYSFCCLCSEDQSAGYPIHVGCHVEIFERAVGGFLSAKLRMEFEQSCKKRQLLIAKSRSRMYKSWIQLIETLTLTKLKYG
jgi:hypothetical protein